MCSVISKEGTRRLAMRDVRVAEEENTPILDQ